MIKSSQMKQDEGYNKGIWSFEFSYTMNVWFLEAWVCNLNKFNFFSELLQSEKLYFEVKGACVAHSTLDSTCEVLKNEAERTSKRNISFHSLSAERLRIDLAACLLLLCHIRTH